MKSIKLFIFGICLSLVSMVTSAAAIYDNFGAGDTFNTGIGWTISSNTSQGLQFTAADTGIFSSLDVGMGVTGSTPPGDVLFKFYADAGNSLGTLLESITVTVNNSFGSPGVSSGLASGSTILTAGQNYWLIAEAFSGVNTPWNRNNIGDVGNLHWTNGSISSGDEAGVFRINANAVPEPETLILFGLGLAGLGFHKRKCKNL